MFLNPTATMHPHPQRTAGERHQLLPDGGSETAATLTPEDYTISNVKDGKVTALYTNIQNKLGQIGVQNMVDFYKVKGIGNTSNLEWHIFQIQSNAAYGDRHHRMAGHGERAVHRGYSYFPLLTTDMYGRLQVWRPEGYRYRHQA